MQNQWLTFLKAKVFLQLELQASVGVVSVVDILSVQIFFFFLCFVNFQFFRHHFRKKFCIMYPIVNKILSSTSSFLFLLFNHQKKEETSNIAAD